MIKLWIHTYLIYGILSISIYFSFSEFFAWISFDIVLEHYECIWVTELLFIFGDLFVSGINPCKNLGFCKSGWVMERTCLELWMGVLCYLTDFDFGRLSVKIRKQPVIRMHHGIDDWMLYWSFDFSSLKIVYNLLTVLSPQMNLIANSIKTQG